jgi:hypothetical protein
MTSGSGPKNYTTVVDAAKTAAECMALLARHHARQVSIDYDDEGEPSGLSFVMATPWGPRQFALPVSADGTLKRLREAYDKGGTGVQSRHVTRQHARRVAWRVRKDWLDAQLAMIDAGQGELAEVMLPWVRVDPRHTMWEAYQEHELRALEQ